MTTRRTLISPHKLHVRQTKPIARGHEVVVVVGGGPNTDISERSGVPTLAQRRPKTKNTQCRNNTQLPRLQEILLSASFPFPA